MQVTVTAKPNAGVDQTICQYTTATMAATGVGTWTALSSNPATTTITTPASATTTITGFTVAGDYNYVWTVNGCTDTVQVTVTAKPDAGPDLTICQYTTATTAAFGPGIWTALSTNPALTTIITPNSAGTTIDGFTVAGNYNYVWTVNGCTDTMRVTVIAKPNAGIDQGICLFTTTNLAATGVGTWVALPSNPAAVTITNASSPTTGVSGFSTTGLYQFEWTVNGCTDTMAISVGPKPDAGSDQTICQYATATMAAIGTGTWLSMSSNATGSSIVSASAANTQITGNITAGTYNYIWTENGCTDTAQVIVIAKPNAGADQTICQRTTATLSASGSGAWSTLSTNPTALTFVNSSAANSGVSGFDSAGVYDLVWTVNGCDDTMRINVTPIPDAGADQSICQYTSTVMSAVGAGTWAAATANPQVVTFANSTSPTSAVSGFNTPGNYKFIWTVNGCSDTVIINVKAKPNAGADQVVCQYTDATLSTVLVGSWNALSANPSATSIATDAANHTIATGLDVAGVYGFFITVNGCTDTMNVSVTAKPNAGVDQTICQYTATSLAAIGNGTWTTLSTNPIAVNVSNPTSPNTAVTGFTVSGAYNFVWTVNGCTDTMTVNVTAKPDAGVDQSICQYDVATMAALGNTGAWSTLSTNPATTNFALSTFNTTTVSGFTVAGSYGYVWTLGGCTDTMFIQVKAKPDAGIDQTICQYTTATMAAIGVGTWTDLSTNPAAASIANPSSATTSISGFTVAGSYGFVWTVNGCTDTMIVDVTAKPNAGTDQTICQYATAAMNAVGSGTWSALASNPATVTFTNISAANTVVSGFSNTGTYSLVWTVNGCTDTVVITVAPQPTVVLRDTSICNGNNLTWTANGQPAGGSYVWSSGQNTGTISINPTSTGSYTVTYALGICTSADTATVTINTLPTATVTTNNSICTTSNGTAAVHVSGGAPGYQYVWSVPGNTDSISNLASASYTVTVTDVNGCKVTATAQVGIDTPTIPINLVSIHNLKCNGDATGSISINAVDSGTLVYQWSPSGSTSTISGLAANTYTVTVTDQFGCKGTAQYTVSQPPVLTLSAPAFVDPTCHGGADGTATDTASGGSGNYHYSWNTTPAQNTQVATGLSATSYTVIVTDDSSCVASATVTLNDPAAITFAAPVITDAICFGTATGTAQAVPQNGVGVYTYNWDDPASQTSNPATGLLAGTYHVTAHDSKGCTASTTIIINEPTQVLVAATGTDLTCPGANNGTATAVASGGTPGYTYLWNNNATQAAIANLSLGTYTVTATDQHGCKATASVAIGQPYALSLTATGVRTSCSDSKDGKLTAIGSGGSGGLSYSIKDTAGNLIQTSADGVFTGLGHGTYVVVVTDDHSCFDTIWSAVPRAPFNTYTATADSTSCYGSQYKDGRIHVQGFTIANGPYLFSVDSGPLQYIPDFFDLAAGSHVVRAVDNYGCDTTFAVVVGEPLPAVVNILPGDSTIEMGSTIQLSTTFAPYSVDSIESYNWSPGVGLSCIDCPSPVAGPYDPQTIYTLTVTYNQGCIATTSVRINVQGDPPVYIPNAFTPNGDGMNDQFFVYGEGIKTLQVMVFNRWGEKVFETDNQSVGWDGYYKGELQPPGVYVYVVDLLYLNNRKRVKEGSITLIR
jgi:gliding motility-associated-like protein